MFVILSTILLLGLLVVLYTCKSHKYQGLRDVNSLKLDNEPSVSPSTTSLPETRHKRPAPFKKKEKKGSLTYQEIKKQWEPPHVSLEKLDYSTELSNPSNHVVVDNLPEVKTDTLLEYKPSWFQSVLDKWSNKIITEKSLESVCTQMETCLLERQMNLLITQEIIQQVKREWKEANIERWKNLSSLVKKVIKDKIGAHLNFQDPQELIQKIQAKPRKPYTIAIVGVNGLGKTTTCAKLTYWFKKEGLKVAIAACDTFRSGAIEQLQVHAKKLDVPLFQKKYGSDAASVAFEAISRCEKSKTDVLLIDTAGRLQTNVNLMISLQKLIKISVPDMVLFLGEAQCGNDLIHQVTEFQKYISDVRPRGIDCLGITKVDMVHKNIGSIVSLSYLTQKPILFLGTGQFYEDMEFCSASRLMKLVI